jgi:hypothetical protein
MYIVMGLGPIHPNKDHLLSPLTRIEPNLSLEAASSPLMDQCSKHNIPPAVTATSPTSRGTV